MDNTKKQKRVLFCILQDRANSSNSLNEVMYVLQDTLRSENQNGTVCEKAFVSIGDRVDIRDFGENDIDKVYYLNYLTRKHINLCEAVCSTMHVLQNKINQDRKNNLTGQYILVFLTNLKEISEEENFLLERLFPGYGKLPVCSFLIQETRLNGNAIGNFCLNHGGTSIDVQKILNLFQKNAEQNAGN